MVNEDKAYDESENVFAVDGPSGRAELSMERAIEKVIRIHGRLIITPQSLDCDKDGNFIEYFSTLNKIAEKYVKVFNPLNLSMRDYREAYILGDLPWQIG